MTLQNATLEQLVAWQQDIVLELARRAAPAPQVARAPWETPGARAMEELQALHAAEYRTPVDPRAAELAALQERMNAAAAPSMLAGQRTPVIRPTAKTDPAFAERFAAVPARPDGAPGLRGNGRGEGMIDIGPRGD